MDARTTVALGLLAGTGAWLLPGALDRFVFPKLALAAVAAAVALSVPARGRLHRPAALLLAAAAVLLLAGALAGPAPLAALVGRGPRYEGAVALPVYLGALIAGARLLGPQRHPGSVRLLCDVLAVAAIAVAGLAVLQTAGLRPLSADVARPGSLLGNASDQGAWAVLAGGPLIASGLLAREPLHVAGAIAAAVAVATSGSRGALLGALVLTLVLGALVRGRASRWALAAGLALLAVAVLALPGVRPRVLGTSPLAGRTSTGRVALWGDSLALLAARPVLGVGPSGFVDTIPAHHSRRYERAAGARFPPDSPHDWLLQAATAGGPLLALLAAALALLTLARGRRAAGAATGAARALPAGLVAGLAGYAVALLFGFTTPGGTPLAALFAGALLSVAPGAAAHRLARRAAIAAYATSALVLAAAAAAEVPLRTGLSAAGSGRVAAADRAFSLARDLRPWDPAVAQTATHAYALLARGDTPQAAARGRPWARRARSAYPDSIPTLEDAAALAAAAGDQRQAARLRLRARRLAPAR